ncbi:MAG: hypothetical protein M3Q69_04135 [Acidobacteriota bacterium]|nr:hypothetical protein [Acidobacteriota bacterium]
MRKALAAAALAFSFHASAGVVYDFRTTVESERFSENASGRVWVEGDSYRAEVTRADGKRLAVISRDADRTATILDLQSHTAKPRVRVSGPVLSSSIFHFPIGRASVFGIPIVTYRRDGRTTIARERAVVHVIEARFAVVSDRGQVGGTYNVIARIATSENLPSLPMKTPIRTGYASVDEQLAKAADNLRGMVLRHELEIRRALDGGPTQIERTTTVVTKLQRAEIPATQFAVTVTPVAQ